MDPARAFELRSRGGKAVQAMGKAHKFTPEEAREAGKKGGLAASRDHERMVAIGRLGGKKRVENARRKKVEAEKVVGGEE